MSSQFSGRIYIRKAIALLTCFIPGLHLSCFAKADTIRTTLYLKMAYISFFSCLPVQHNILVLQDSLEGKQFKG